MGETKQVDIVEDGNQNLDTEEYQQQMIQKSEQGLGINTSNEGGGDTGSNKGESSGETLLAGKYKSEEDLQKGVLELLKKQNEGKTLEDIYKTLESGLGSKKDSKVETDSDNEAQAGSEDAESKKGKKEEEGSDGGDSKEPSPDKFAKYTEELVANGTLSDESYAELRDMGIPKEMVDQYIAGSQAQGELLTMRAYDLVGGSENYGKMLQWAKGNLTESEIESFNQSVISPDETTRAMAIRALYSMYTNAEGTAPTNLLDGDGAPSRTAERYESVAQLKADMNKPEYSTDPAFRAKVERKLANSNIL